MFLILVNDGSTDSTRDFVTELGERLGDHFIYRENITNIGVNGSWNVGLETAMNTEIPYICIANNDLLFTDGWDIPLIDALDNGFSLVSPYSTEQAIPADWPVGATRHTNPVGLPILGACFMFNRYLIQEQIGYVPKDMTHYFGDNWFCVKCKKLGLKYGHIRESYIHHFFCQTSAELDNNKWFPLDIHVGPRSTNLKEFIDFVNTIIKRFNIVEFFHPFNRKDHNTHVHLGFR